MTPIELPNHAPTSHDGWVNTEIEPLAQESSLAACPTVADTEAQPRLRICNPLEVEFNKPRLIWDARYLNSICKHPPFQMDGVGKVARCSRKGSQQVTLDHKSRLTMSCWSPSPGSTTLGRYCVSDGVPPPYMYHSLSDAVVQYLRSQDILTSAWLDDFGCQNLGIQATSARSAKEGSPRGGGPRTFDVLRLQLHHGLSKMLTGTHHRPGLPGRRLRHGATQLLRA